MDSIQQPSPSVNLKLHPQHRAILAYLHEQAGRVVSLPELFAGAFGRPWSDDPDLQRADTNNLHVHISHIRRVLGADAVINRRGYGYIAGHVQREERAA
jgi:DNA-binding response OmpR family regulator